MVLRAAVAAFLVVFSLDALGQTRIVKPSPARVWAQKMVRSMTTREIAGQLVMITSYGEAPGSRSAAFRDFVKSVRDLRVGGIIVVNRVLNGTVRQAEPYAMAAFLNRMQKLAKVPLLVGADLERGASMRVAGTTRFPHMMAYGAAGDTTLTAELGRITAQEARALGVHWVFAPVSDVNNNPDNPIINIRSFGEDPARVAAHVRAFIQGAHSDPRNQVLVTAKHFPGHGDTSQDSHMGMPAITADRARLDAVELAPFREAIAAGVDSVMTAHLAVAALDPQPVPATISKPILTGLLQTELNFKGLIVTDAMDMKGLTSEFSNAEAAVRAIEAGVDLLLMPPSPEAAIKGLLAAVRSGRLSRKRLEASALKLLTAKAKVGLHRKRQVNVEEINDVLESPEAQEHALKVAAKAVTLVRNEGRMLPLRAPLTTCLIGFTESRNGVQGRKLSEELRSRAPGTQTAMLDPAMPLVEVEESLNKLKGCTAYVAAAFVTVSAYRGNVALPGLYTQTLEKLIASGTPVALISLGSPYLLRNFPAVQAYLATLSTVPASETAAIQVILGQSSPEGKLPVTIPQLAPLRHGLRITQ